MTTSSDLRQAIEPILTLIGSVLCAVVGYQIAGGVFHDGEKAVVGLLWGAITFSLACCLAAFSFRRAYRARGGSPWLVAIVSTILPVGMLALTILG